VPKEKKKKKEENKLRIRKSIAKIYKNKSDSSDKTKAF
jgi:hypothetical protein